MGDECGHQLNGELLRKFGRKKNIEVYSTVIETKTAFAERAI